ncbi:MAG: hypothetical protein PHG25_02980 [Candidatus Pacebacteria bacterium]|nr:hypothetical protein [Candidatus Paceibacterota bacterium]
MEGKHQYRIKNAAIILVVAGFADALTFIPGAGDIVAFIYWPLAAVYFWKNGLGFVNGRRLAVEAISFVAELIPVAQEFPTIFAATAAIVAMSRVEDKTGFKIPLKGGGNRRAPVNHGGVRLPQSTNNHIAPAPLNHDGVRH